MRGGHLGTTGTLGVLTLSRAGEGGLPARRDRGPGELVSGSTIATVAEHPETGGRMAGLKPGVN